MISISTQHARAVAIAHFYTLLACNQLAGIDSQSCVPACVDGKTRLFCDQRGEPQTEACPSSISECAEASCQRGQCTFEPVVGKPCGSEGRGLCNRGFACIGQETKLSANHRHTCLVGEDGRIWCWGENADHQLGDGTAQDRGNPVLVRNLPGEATDVSAGYAHTCALLRDGAIACWGNNSAGQCGVASSTEPLVLPELVPVPGETFIVLTAGRAHTCALSTERSVYCWGDTSYGQAGVDPQGTGSQGVGPTQVIGVDKVVGIETVKDHTCATRSASPTFVCWGSNVYGEQGDSIVHKLGPNAAGLAYSAVPVPVEFEFPPLDVGISADATYALTGDGRLFAWGLNTRGLLGSGSPQESVSVPSSVVTAGGLSGFGSVLRTGGIGQCAGMRDRLTYNTSFLCWGENDTGELGLGEQAGDTDVPLPYPVRAVPPVSRALVRAEDHGCAIASEAGREEIWCYGAAALVGNGTTRNDGASTAIQWQGAPVRWDPESLAGIVE